MLELKAFRDSFAHAAGQMPARQTALHSSIAKCKRMGLALKVQDGYWAASPRLAAHYFLRTEQAYKLFSEAFVNSYVARMTPRDDV